MPSRGLIPTGAYAVSDIETINVTNGNVLYRIPLTSLPPGRAGWTAGVNLVYNSQIYDLVYSAEASQVAPYAETIFERLSNSGSGGGWQYGYIYSLDLEYRTSINGFGCGAGHTDADFKIYKLSIISPDGSHHALHLYPYTPSNPSGYSYWDYYGDAYYPIDPTGFSVSGCGVRPPVGDLTYYTSDGSYLKVVMSQTGGAGWYNHQWTIYFPDGSTPTGYGAQMTALSDHNGNSITVVNTINPTYGLPATTTLSDGLGRSILIQYNPAAGVSNQDTITQTGYAEAGVSHTLTWTINWGYTSLSGATQNYTCSLAGDYCSLSGSGSRVVTSIALPTPEDNSSQTIALAYDTNGGWGELNSVALPSGASVLYQYSQHGQGKLTTGSSLTENPVSQKQLTWTDEADGSQRAETWSYTFASTNSWITNPDGGTVTNYFNDPHMLSNPLAGLITKIVQPDGSTMEKTWWNNRPVGSQSSDPANPYVAWEVRSVASGGSPVQGSAKHYVYDRNGNQTQLKEYDWVSPYTSIGRDSIGQPTPFATQAATRATSKGYYYSTSNSYTGSETITDDAYAYWHPGSPGIRNLLTSATTTGVGPGSSTTYSYFDTFGHPNLTQENHWDSYSGTNITINYTYDGNGNVLTVQNARGYTTSYSYNSMNCMTQRTTAQGQTQARTFNYTCDTNLGVILTAADVDHSITRSYDYDRFGRNTLVTENGGGLSRKKQSSYSDGGRWVQVKADRDTFGDLILSQVTYFDQLGRVRQTNDPAGSILQTRYYTPPAGQNGFGYSYKVVSNPYVTQSEPTMGWHLTTFDRNGRTISLQHFSGSALPTPWSGGNTSSSGTVSTSYSSNATTVTDESTTVTRISYQDGLGRLSQVTESGIPATMYTYDALDNLTNVTQPNVTGRTFTYSSLSRLTSAYNPETGTVNYTYDANGDLLSRTRGGVTASYTYNELDQISGKTYSDYNNPNPTPWVSYTYNKGWLTSVSAGNTTYQYTTFDGLGRVTASSQTTNAHTYSLGYTYNLADGITSLTLPSGRVVNTSYDGAGRPSGVTGALNGVSKTYASAISYATHGAIQQLTLGNIGNTKVEQTCFNARLQPIGIRLGSATTTNCANSGDLLNLAYTYSSSNNNGNLLSQTITRAAQSWSQSYGYDSVNRLTSAVESGSGNWSQSYSYSASGNRAVSGYMPYPGSTPQALSAYNSNNQWTGASYDGAGNQTALPSGSFTFDAEGRLNTASESNMNSISYSYDGDGRRVTKTVGAAVTVYVYDTTGQLAVEYDTRVPNATGTTYLTADHLGSTRLVTSGSTWAQLQCFDYLPFGEEIATNTFGRSSCFPAGTYPINPSPDMLAQKFTGKERDAETGFDFFGARSMSSSQGRFTSPDPLLASADPRVPQSWNRYAYGLNNPLRYIDPTGLDAISSEECTKNPDCIRVQLNVVFDRNANIYDTHGNLLPKYQQKLDAQLAQAADEYGTVGIHFDVTYTQGAVDPRTRTISEGASSSGLNVAVTDAEGVRSTNIAAFGSIQAGGQAIVMINMQNSDVHSGTLGHELAHHFQGDTRFAVAGLLNLITFGALNAFSDIVNDANRSELRAQPAFSQSWHLRGNAGVVEDLYRIGARWYSVTNAPGH